MKIHKVLNNNFVIILNDDGNEQIIGGKGIAFGKRVGDYVDCDVINKTFIIPCDSNREIVNQFIDALPIEYFEIAISVVELAKVKTEKAINQGVVLAIADHMYSSIIRHNQGIQIPNYLLWELKKFYQVEFEVGLYALDLIKSEFGISLPEDEAGFIATHIIDGELDNSNIDQVYKTATLIKDISNIVKYYFNIDFDSESIYYYRFITHLKFFAGRLFNDYTFSQNDDDRLYEMLKKTYINSFKCALKIGEYLSKQYSYSLSKEETIYLTIHIENVIYKSNK